MESTRKHSTISSSSLNKYRQMTQSYQDAFNQIDDAQGKINLRINRLKTEKDNLRMKSPQKYLSANMFTQIDPMFYPIETPINGEPIG